MSNVFCLTVQAHDRASVYSLQSQQNSTSYLGTPQGRGAEHYETARTRSQPVYPASRATQVSNTAAAAEPIKLQPLKSTSHTSYSSAAAAMTKVGSFVYKFLPRISAWLQFAHFAHLVCRVATKLLVRICHTSLYQLRHHVRHHRFTKQRVTVSAHSISIKIMHTNRMGASTHSNHIAAVHHHQPCK